jgi:hypothetical protein
MRRTLDELLTETLTTYMGVKQAVHGDIAVLLCHVALADREAVVALVSEYDVVPAGELVQRSSGGAAVEAVVLLNDATMATDDDRVIGQALYACGYDGERIGMLSMRYVVVDGDVCFEPAQTENVQGGVYANALRAAYEATR